MLESGTSVDRARVKQDHLWTRRDRSGTLAHLWPREGSNGDVNSHLDCVAHNLFDRRNKDTI